MMSYLVTLPAEQSTSVRPRCLICTVEIARHSTEFMEFGAGPAGDWRAAGFARTGLKVLTVSKICFSLIAVVTPLPSAVKMR